MLWVLKRVSQCLSHCNSGFYQRSYDFSDRKSKLKILIIYFNIVRFWHATSRWKRLWKTLPTRCRTSELDNKQRYNVDFYFRFTIGKNRTIVDKKKHSRARRSSGSEYYANALDTEKILSKTDLSDLVQKMWENGEP